MKNERLALRNLPCTCLDTWSWAHLFTAARHGADGLTFEVALETRITFDRLR